MTVEFVLLFSPYIAVRVAIIGRVNRDGFHSFVFSFHGRPINRSTTVFYVCRMFRSVECTLCHDRRKREVSTHADFELRLTQCRRRVVRRGYYRGRNFTEKTKGCQSLSIVFSRCFKEIELSMPTFFIFFYFTPIKLLHVYSR